MHAIEHIILTSNKKKTLIKNMKILGPGGVFIRGGGERRRQRRRQRRRKRRRKRRRRIPFFYGDLANAKIDFFFFKFKFATLGPKWLFLAQKYDFFMKL